jgi:hypothetical protein
VRLLAYAVVDSFGYRQLCDVWRVQGTWDALRRRRGWGRQERRGLGEPAAAA